MAISDTDIQEVEVELCNAFGKLCEYASELEDVEGDNVVTLIKIGAAMAAARTQLRQLDRVTQTITSTGQPGERYDTVRD